MTSLDHESVIDRGKGYFLIGALPLNYITITHM